MRVDETRFPQWLSSLDPLEVPCLDCGRKIVWGTTRSGHKCPIDISDEITADVYRSHHATCNARRKEP